MAEKLTRRSLGGARIGRVPIVVMGVAAPAVIMTAVLVAQLAGPADVPATAGAAPLPLSQQTAQTYSPYCQTPEGICTLPSALPVGSACMCGPVAGTIVP